MPEVPDNPCEIEDRPHADVVERIQGVHELRPGAGHPAEAVQAFQNALEPGDLGLQVVPDVGVEVVGIQAAAILHAVAEPGIDQVDAVLLHHQHHVVVHRRYAGSDGDVEGDGTAVVLGHLGRDGIPADPVPGLEQAKVEPVRVVMQRPCGCEPGYSPTDDGYAPWHRPSLMPGCRLLRLASEGRSRVQAGSIGTDRGFRCRSADPLNPIRR